MNSYSQELYHHGILKMRWGQRNGPPYPLKDSQKTSSEKKAESKSTSASKEKTSNASKDSAASAQSLSDDELRTKIARMALEKQYNSLMKEKLAETENKVSMGKKFVDKILAPAAEDVGKSLTKYYLGQFANKITGEEIFKPAKKLGKEVARTAANSVEEQVRNVAREAANGQSRSQNSRANRSGENNAENNNTHETNNTGHNRSADTERTERRTRRTRTRSEREPEVEVITPERDRANNDGEGIFNFVDVDFWDTPVSQVPDTPPSLITRAITPYWRQR